MQGLREKNPPVGMFAMVSAITVVDNENLVFTCPAPCPGLSFPPRTAREAQVALTPPSRPAVGSQIKGIGLGVGTAHKVSLGACSLEFCRRSCKPAMAGDHLLPDLDMLC